MNRLHGAKGQRWHSTVNYCLAPTSQLCVSDNYLSKKVFQIKCREKMQRTSIDVSTVI